MKHPIAARLLSILFLVSGTAAAEAFTVRNNPSHHAYETVHLKFNLKPGDKYIFSSVIKQQIVQTAMGQQMITTQDMTNEYLYDVRSVKNGITEINVTFGAIKMDTDVAGIQRITYDSSEPDAASGELGVMSKLIGKSFLLYIDEAGKVEKVTGLAEIIDNVDGEQSEILKQSFGDSSLVLSMNQITNIYPNKPVAAGDTWVKHLSGPLAGMMHSESTFNYALNKVSDGIAHLDVDGQMSFTKLESGGNPMLQAAEFNLSGTQQGTAEVDVATGLPVLTRMKQQISGNLAIQGMEIPMSIESDITITGKKM